MSGPPAVAPCSKNEELVVFFVQGVDDHADPAPSESSVATENLPDRRRGASTSGPSGRRFCRTSASWVQAVVHRGPGVAREGHGLAQPVGPAGQQRIVFVAAGSGRGQQGFDQGAAVLLSSSRRRSTGYRRRNAGRGFFVRGHFDPRPTGACPYQRPGDAGGSLS